MSALPSVERLLQHSSTVALIAEFGRAAVTEAIRSALAQLRARLTAGADFPGEQSVIESAAHILRQDAAPSLRRVFNLTGTVLHTNLGRAALPEEAIAAVTLAAREPVNLEFDTAQGRRGDRDAHVERLLAKLTGAEAATVVNNNAAAVVLVLHTLARRKEVITSRGELIEIGGSFRLPDIMASAGVKLREVGTTNRTHLEDYARAIGAKTGLVMKVHTSNYSIQGFTSSVGEAELARFCRERSVPFAVDLGSGTLVDLERYGLPHETTPAECIARGADLVTFSGDKLLGGPQAGVIVGRANLVTAIKRHPLKRALRVDKMTIAALEAVLRLYANPEKLPEKLPTLRLLTRPVDSIRALAERLRPLLAERLDGIATVETIACESQPGSGSLPTQTVASAGLAIRPVRKNPAAKHGEGAALERLARAFRALPIPVIGRMEDGALVFDCRCLEQEAAFVEQLTSLHLRRDSPQ